jgi:hypothetical protein
VAVNRFRAFCLGYRQKMFKRLKHCRKYIDFRTS